MLGSAKSKTSTNDSARKVGNVRATNSVCDTPMICLLNCSEAIEEELRKLGFNCFHGTIGSEIEVNNTHRTDQKLVELNHDYPNNFHEFDVVVLDLVNISREKYNAENDILSNTRGNSAYALSSQYPEQVFNPIPLSVSILSTEIAELSTKESIVIAFCNEEVSASYEFVEITSYGPQVTSNTTCSSLEFYKRMPSREMRRGKKAYIPDDRSKLSPLLEKHLDTIRYGTKFRHPLSWNGKESQKDPAFKPLLVNEREEIISYVHFVDQTIILVFPDIQNRSEFIGDLFKTYLPEIRPKLFPFHGQFGWLTNGEYLVPGEQELIDQRNQIEKDYNESLEENEKAIDKLKGKFKFLSNMLSESGENLVISIEHYLQWLGFESVTNLDETSPGVLEEDIQVDCGNRFLAIEVKGLGGTSTDKDCSQIAKIRHRRGKQRDKHDVFGLYVVNHQRYLPPKSRKNPPFTKNQIEDAVSDSRGLLTTYELYKAYFLIEAGILSKETVRESLFNTGLILFSPADVISIGSPHECYQGGEVAIVNIENVTVKKGDKLIVKNDDTYFKAEILTLQINEEDVDSAQDGEIGIKLNQKVTKNCELFIEST